MKTSADKVIKLIEVNPCLGGRTIFTALAGANFPKMILDMVIHQIPTTTTTRDSQITVVRYFE